MTKTTSDDYVDIRGTNARKRIAKVEWNKLDPAKALEIEELLNNNGIETK